MVFTHISFSKVNCAEEVSNKYIKKWLKKAKDMDLAIMLQS